MTTDFTYNQLRQWSHSDLLCQVMLLQDAYNAKMRENEIANTPINPSRLIFNASLLYNKRFKDLTAEEVYEVRKYSLQK